MRPITPRGFRDVLTAEAAERAAISDSVARVFSAWGYDLVETPVVEDYEMLAAGAGSLESTAFRLFDVDGRLLALRPDMTVPIARLVAARAADDSRVKRFRYRSDVFREHESLRGQARQFNQIGIELIGVGGPSADAEVVALMAESLEAAGLKEFTVALGDASVVAALVEAAGQPQSWGAEVLRAVHKRDLVSLDRLCDACAIPAGIGPALRAVIRTRGGGDAIESCRATLATVGLASVLDPLEETWSILESTLAKGRVIVDFSVTRDFGYYTGLVCEAYAPGLGLPVGGGGRYDGLLGRYGEPQPAAGFALGLERLTIARAEQGAAVPPAEAPTAVGGSAVTAFAEAARRRASGERVTLVHGPAKGDVR